MREYDIYIIRKEIAYTYYGLEEKLFQLFTENRSAAGDLKKVTDKQIDYIIEEINTIELEKYLLTALRNTSGYANDGNKHYIRLSGVKSQAGLYIGANHLTLFAEGTYDAEVRFYEVLRSYNPYFIAMELDEKRYGWLKPLKSFTSEIVQQS